MNNCGIQTWVFDELLFAPRTGGAKPPIEKLIDFGILSLPVSRLFEP